MRAEQGELRQKVESLELEAQEQYDAFTAKEEVNIPGTAAKQPRWFVCTIALCSHLHCLDIAWHNDIFQANCKILTPKPALLCMRATLP